MVFAAFSLYVDVHSLATNYTTPVPALTTSLVTPHPPLPQTPSNLGFQTIFFFSQLGFRFRDMLDLLTLLLLIGVITSNNQVPFAVEWQSNNCVKSVSTSEQL